MSYSDQQTRFSPASLGTVVAVHLAIGYALVSGLAYRVVHIGPPITQARLIPDDHVPPPRMQPTEPQRAASSQPVFVQQPVVEVPLVSSNTVSASDLPPVIPTTGTDLPAQTPTKATPNLARSAQPEGNKAGWVTTDDYPAAALRDEIEGIVTIDVAIDAAGRVSGCTVVTSSGNAALDQVTCRTYGRRARFRPALDDNGQPTTAHRIDRVRWEIPR